MPAYNTLTEHAKRFRTNIDVWKRFVFIVCVHIKENT